MPRVVPSSGQLIGHEIGTPHQLVERHLDRPTFRDGLLVEIGVAGDHLHAEQRAAELGHAAADIAEPTMPNGAAVHVAGR